jgi:AAHS family 4-hydroxybenzoate transporter-like MFS transporter
MAEVPGTTTVNVGEILNRHLSSFQVRVIVVCGLAAVFEGFDIQSIGVLAPAIAQNLRIPIVSFGTIFSLGWAGIMLGTLLAGPIADVWGRRMPVIVSVFIFGVFTLLLSRSNTYNELAIYRFLTGIGLGGVIPNLMALTGEYAPQRLRGRFITIMSSGIPLGSLLGALVGSVVVPAWGWRMLFYIGGILPFVLALVLLKALPESPVFLVTKDTDQANLTLLMTRIAPDLALTKTTRFVLSEASPKGAPVRMLFAQGRGPTTLLIWLLYFSNFMVFMFPYSWLASILRAAGLPLSKALVLTSLLALGGVIGQWVNGWFIDRFGMRRPLITSYFGAFIFMAIFGQIAGTRSLLLLAIVNFITGAFIFAAQGGNNVLTAGVYPTTLRSTGIGFGFTVGRLGSIISPALGGMMLAAHWGFPSMFLIAGLPGIVGGITVICLRTSNQQTAQVNAARA